MKPAALPLNAKKKGIFMKKRMIVLHGAIFVHCIPKRYRSSSHSIAFNRAAFADSRLMAP
jgi:hypothetical protein